MVGLGVKWLLLMRGGSAVDREPKRRGYAIEWKQAFLRRRPPHVFRGR